MDYQYIWLALALLARLFYLAVILSVLWIKGYLWIMFGVASLFLLANLFLSVPISVDTARLNRIITAVKEDDEEPSDIILHRKQPGPRRRK